MRVVVADDHALVRSGLSALVGGMEGVTEVVEAADGDEALAAVIAHRPEVVLLDLSMPRVGGLEAMDRIFEVAPATRVIIVSIHDDETSVREALSAGAAGYVAKSAPIEELEAALQAAGRGEVYLSARLQHAAGEQSELPLTARQREILILIARGMTNR